MRLQPSDQCKAWQGKWVASRQRSHLGWHAGIIACGDERASRSPSDLRARSNNAEVMEALHDAYVIGKK